MKHPTLTRLAALLAAFALALCLTACGGSSSDNYASGGSPSMDAAGTVEGGMELGGTQVPDPSRKIIYTANLTVECTDLAASLAAIEQAVADAGGYIQASDISEYTSRVYAHLETRIPAAQYHAFVAGADAFGNVTHRSEDTEDVTLQYVDVEARLSSLEGQRDRLLTLRDAAEDLDTLLRIEQELADVQYQLESYTSQLNALENQVSYCTVRFDLSQPVILSPSADDFGAKLGTAFARGANNFVEFVQDVVLWLAENIFFLLLIAAIATPIVLLRKKRGGSAKRSGSRFGRRRKTETAETPSAPPQE